MSTRQELKHLILHHLAQKPDSSYNHSGLRNRHLPNLTTAEAMAFFEEMEAENIIKRGCQRCGVTWMITTAGLALVGK